MTTSNKLFIVQSKQGVVGVQELGMEHNLDAIRRVVKESQSTELAQDRILAIIRHVVCHNRRQGRPLECKCTSLQQDLVLARQELSRVHITATINEEEQEEMTRSQEKIKMLDTTKSKKKKVRKSPQQDGLFLLPSRFLEKAGFHAFCNTMDRLLQLLHNRLTLECLNCEGVCLCRGNDKRHDRHG